MKVETLDANGNPVSTVGEYEYDGDGRRIKKRVPSTGEVTVFVYDAGGKLIGEYSTVAAPQSPKVSYTTADHLGSPRILTDENGTTISRRDFMPYGEEIARSAYGSDTVRQKFTGYERDAGTELDFAINRYHVSSHGRFTQPDPYNIIFEMETGEDEEEKERILIAYLSIPQHWNRYVFVINNPLAFTDPDGTTPRTINVFLALPEVTEGDMKDWEKFKSDARKKGITVNIYTINDKTATPEKFLESIKAENTVTIFAGHSFSRGGRKVGIEFHNGGIVGKANAGGRLMTADGVDIRNESVVVFSCNSGGAFNKLTSTNGAKFVTLFNGKDGQSAVGSVYSAAFEYAKATMNGENSVGAAFAAGNGFRRLQTPNNVGDAIIHRKLEPPRRRRR